MIVLIKVIWSALKLPTCKKAAKASKIAAINAAKASARLSKEAAKKTAKLAAKNKKTAAFVGVMGAGAITATATGVPFDEGVGDVVDLLGDAATVVLEPVASTGGAILETGIKTGADLGGTLIESTSIGGMFGDMFGGNIIQYIVGAIIILIILNKIF